MTKKAKNVASVSARAELKADVATPARTPTPTHDVRIMHKVEKAMPMSQRTLALKLDDAFRKWSAEIISTAVVSLNAVLNNNVNN